jgi:hypothetical protein
VKRALTLVLVALAAPATADADDVHAQLRSAPPKAQIGVPVTITFSLSGEGGASPSLVTRDDHGAQQEYAAQPTGKRGVYKARVVFPHPGTWAYDVRVRGQSVELGRFDVPDPAPDLYDTPPLWPLAIVAAAIVGLFVYLRRSGRRGKHAARR